jgi:rhodanese-related sulfurtransferase
MVKTNQLCILFSIIAIFIIVFIYLNYNYYPAKSIHNESALKISIGEAKARRFGLIIDVRSEKERELLGYYPNSIHIAPEILEQQAPLDISNKNTWILIYSNGDPRASTSAEILYRMGYKNVRYIKETYLSLMPGSK